MPDNRPIWIRSTRCESGSCLQVAYRKASGSYQNGDCVEAGTGPHGDILVRDSKLGEASPVLRFTPDQWATVLGAIRDGYQSPWSWLRRDDGAREFVKDGVTLVFSDDEWRAFYEGVDDGEFDLHVLAGVS